MPPTIPSAPPATAAKPATLPNATATERGWDGWPTDPTPEYLIPRLGKLPVSSTAHFRTVAMMSLEAVSAADMSSKLARPVEAVLESRNAETRRDAHKRAWIRSRILTPMPKSGSDLLDRMLEYDVYCQGMEGTTADELAAWLDKHLQSLVNDPKLSLRLEVVPGLAARVLRASAVPPPTGPAAPRRRTPIPAEKFAELRNVPTIHQIAKELADLQGGKMSGFHLKAGEFFILRTGKTFDDIKKDETLFRTLVNVLTEEEPVLRVWMEATHAAPPPIHEFLRLLAEAAVIGGPPKEALAAAHEWLHTRGQRYPEIMKDHGQSLEWIQALRDLAPAPRETPVVSAKPVRWEDAALTPEETQKLARAEKHADDVFSPPPASLEELHARLEKFGIDVHDLKLDLPSKPDTWEDAFDSLFHLQPEGAADPLKTTHDATDKPVEGVLLYHEQGWFGRGLALGNLLHSVALAPGEVTKIAMTHWNHDTRATDSETDTQADTTSESDTQDRAVSEIQAAAAQEHSAGGSFGSSSSASEQGGYSGFGVSVSAGASQSVSSAFSYSDGSKNLSMQANQHVAAVTQRHAEAARTRRATVVREISQSEDQSVVTRVLANYNHMHALTVMYFEVIEVYDLKTRVVDAERLIFLPFVVHDVAKLIPQFRPVLIDAANAAGKPNLAAAIRYFQAKDADLAKDIAALTAQRDDARKQVEDVRLELVNVPTRFSDQRHAIETNLTNLSTQRREAAQILQPLASALGGVLQALFERELRPFDDRIRELRDQLNVLAAAESNLRFMLQQRLNGAQARLDFLTGRLNQLEETKRLLDKLEGGGSGGFDDFRLSFNQAAWLSLSPSQVLGLARRRYKDEVLCENIDPTPVGISGNYVAYRWRFKDPIQGQEFKQRYVEPFVGDPEGELRTVSATIAVPTGGVFGEAVLGQAVSAEKIDLSRFWNWKDSMIPILPPDINPLTVATPTAQTLDTKPTGLDASSAKLDKLQDLPAPSGLGELAGTMRAQIFRDMSGMDMLKSLAEATTKAAATGASDAAAKASENYKAGLSFVKDMAPQVLAAVAGPETGGASLLGGMLNAKDAGSKEQILGKVADAVLGGGKGLPGKPGESAGEGATGAGATGGAGTSGGATPATPSEGGTGGTSGNAAPSGGAVPDSELEDVNPAQP